LEQKNYGEVNRALQKTQRILNHLKVTLDFKYEISNNLDALYEYFIRQVVAANVQKNPAPLDEIMPMIKDLRDAYCEADKRSRANANIHTKTAKKA
jgi:flagellar protein FliS